MRPVLFAEIIVSTTAKYWLFVKLQWFVPGAAAVEGAVLRAEPAGEMPRVPG